MSFHRITYQNLMSFLISFSHYLSLFFIKQQCDNKRKERIVAIVLSWKRTKNLPLVISGLKKQSYIDDIIIFHNHPSWLRIPGCKNIFSDLNLDCIIRHQLASTLNDYDYFVFIDDNLRLVCDLAEEVLPAIKTHGKESVLGFFGHNLNFKNEKTAYTSGPCIESKMKLSQSTL